MKPVQDMLNFLWKKTSRKSTGEPPIIQASSVNGDSYENVHRFKQKAPSRPHSMYVEANGNSSHPLQVGASTSLDECSFLDACVNPNENHAQHGEANTRCRDMPYRNSARNKSESQLNRMVDEPAKYYHSPKISSRFQPSSRNSGHNRSHSVFTSVHQVGSERAATRTEVEGTPRMYKKNPLNSNRIMSHYGGLANVSFDGSTTGSCHSDSQGSQWSFWEDGSSDPVPPPRRRRNKPREVFSETSSQSSSDRTDISRLAVNADDTDEHERSENDSVSSVCVQDSMELSLHLPPGFSDLGLDLFDMKTATEFNSNFKHADQNYESPEPCAETQPDDVSRLESTHKTEILSTHADPHLNRASVSSGCFEEMDVYSNSDELPQKTKLRSETIVKSLFAKGKHCSENNVLRNSGSVETEEETGFVVIDTNTTLNKHNEQDDHILPKTLPEFPKAAVNDLTQLSEYQDSRVERTSEKPPPWYHESSTDDIFYTPVSDETDWKIVFCSGRAIQKNCGNGAKPDVLIGTDQKGLGSCLSSPPSDSDQSFDAGQEDTKAVEDCRLPIEKELVHDLVVFHQLRGSPADTVVKIGEACTAQDVIERILHLEKLPSNWYLYKLCTNSPDPKVINNDCVELDFRDCPLMHVRQDHRGPNVRFELHQKDGIQIRVTCDAGLERTKTLVLGISCEETCQGVLDIAAQKLGLNITAKLCLIQVERNEKGCPMKRVPENQIMAQLHSDYFLLCEREFLAGPSDIRDRSIGSSTRSRSSFSRAGNPSAAEVDRLERKVADLEKKLVECEKTCQQKLQKQENQLDSYRAIAFCTDPLTKVMLLEAEMQRLTTEMLDQECQMQIYRDLYKTSRQSGCERKNFEDELAAVRKSLSAIEKERTEVYKFLTVTRTEELQTNKTSASENGAPPLYDICREYEGSCCLYCLQLDRSSLTGQEEQLQFKNNVNHFHNGRNNDGLSLMAGDRILEINGRLVHHLNEKKLLAAVGEMTENLRVVVLREETPTTDIYVL